MVDWIVLSLLSLEMFIIYAGLLRLHCLCLRTLICDYTIKDRFCLNFKNKLANALLRRISSGPSFTYRFPVFYMKRGWISFRIDGKEQCITLTLFRMKNTSVFATVSF